MNHDRFENMFEGTKGIIVFSLFFWLSIIFLVGTHLRSREGDLEPGIDWLVMVQIVFSIAAVCLAVLLIILSKNPLGYGSKILIFYVIAAGLSALFSNYTFTVIGYWMLLLGISLLTIALVQRVKSEKALDMIENTWLILVTIMLLKDLITFYLIGNTSINGETTRLGTGVTHSNAMSLQAVLAYILSLDGEKKRPKYIWLLRFFFIFIIIGSRTRIAMLAFIFGNIIYAFFKARKYQYLGIIILSSFFVIVLLYFLGLSIDISFIKNTFNSFNRNQDLETLMSLSRRTDIWDLAIYKIKHRPLENHLFGSGYGVTRLVLNENSRTALFFYAYHCHNVVLQHILAMGIFGVIPYIALVIYSLKWFITINNSREYFSERFQLHAIVIITIFFLISITEVPIGGKINPNVVLYLFYIISLDRLNQLRGDNPSFES